MFTSQAPVGATFVKGKKRFVDRYTKAQHYAGIVMDKVRKDFMLGSPNISATLYSEHTDSYHVFPGDRVRNHTLEALLDIKICDLAEKRIKSYRKNNYELRLKLQKQGISDKDIENFLLKRVATIAASQYTGNCGELSRYAFVEFATEADVDFSVEFMGFSEPLDHEFLVLNRDPKTYEESLQTWNSTAIIFDPWLRGCYSPLEFEKLWRDNGKGSPSAWLGIDYPTISLRKWKREYGFSSDSLEEENLLQTEKFFDIQEIRMMNRSPDSGFDSEATPRPTSASFMAVDLPVSLKRSGSPFKSLSDKYSKPDSF